MSESSKLLEFIFEISNLNSDLNKIEFCNSDNIIVIKWNFHKHSKTITMEIIHREIQEIQMEMIMKLIVSGVDYSFIDLICSYSFD